MRRHKRPNETAVNLGIATLVAMRGTCARLQVGCVLTNSFGHIIGTGRNGNASGEDHCIDSPCPGADTGCGQGNGTCEATHAEANALLQCGDVQKIDTVFVTHSPCRNCLKLLKNTSCKHIVYLTKSTGVHEGALESWDAMPRRTSVQHSPVNLSGYLLKNWE